MTEVRFEKSRRKTALAAVVVSVAVTAPLYAYTDPGSGALLLQLLLASLAGAAFYFRRGWDWITRRLSGEKAVEEPSVPVIDDGRNGS